MLISIARYSAYSSEGEGSPNVRKPRDWSKVIDRLNGSRSGELKVKMGSPGSAQVTRCRLLAQWDNLDAETVGATLVLRLKR
jgi:hypothetical protein